MDLKDKFQEKISQAEAYFAMESEAEHKEGIKYLLEAANEGSADAAFALGECYQDGLGVCQNLKEAHRWFLKILTNT